MLQTERGALWLTLVWAKHQLKSSWALESVTACGLGLNYVDLADSDLLDEEIKMVSRKTLSQGNSVQTNDSSTTLHPAKSSSPTKPESHKILSLKHTSKPQAANTTKSNTTVPVATAPAKTVTLKTTKTQAKTATATKSATAKTATKSAQVTHTAQTTGKASAQATTATKASTAKVSSKANSKADAKVASTKVATNTAKVVKNSAKATQALAAQDSSKGASKVSAGNNTSNDDTSSTQKAPHKVLSLKHSAKTKAETKAAKDAASDSATAPATTTKGSAKGTSKVSAKASESTQVATPATVSKSKAKSDTTSAKAAQTPAAQDSSKVSAGDNTTNTDNESTQKAPRKVLSLKHSAKTKTDTSATTTTGSAKDAAQKENAQTADVDTEDGVAANAGVEDIADAGLGAVTDKSINASANLSAGVEANAKAPEENADASVAYDGNFPKNEASWHLYLQLKEWLESPTKVDLKCVPEWLTKVWALAYAPYCQPEISFNLILQVVNNSKLLNKIAHAVSAWNGDHALESELWAGLYAARSFMSKEQLPKSTNRRRYMELKQEMDSAHEHWQRALTMGFEPAGLLLERLKGYQETLEDRLKHAWLDDLNQEQPQVSAATLAMFGEPSELNGDESLAEALAKISQPLSHGYYQGYAGAINALSRILRERYANRQQVVYLNVLDHLLCSLPSAIPNYNGLPEYMQQILQTVYDSCANHDPQPSVTTLASAQAQDTAKSASAATWAQVSSAQATTAQTTQETPGQALAAPSADPTLITSAAQVPAASVAKRAVTQIPWYHLPWLYIFSQRLVLSREFTLDQDTRLKLRQTCLQSLMLPAIQLLPLHKAQGKTHGNVRLGSDKLPAPALSGAKAGELALYRNEGESEEATDGTALLAELAEQLASLPRPASLAGQVLDLNPWVNESTALAVLCSIAACYDLVCLELNSLNQLSLDATSGVAGTNSVTGSIALKGLGAIKGGVSASTKMGLSLGESLSKAEQQLLKTVQTHLEYFLLLQSTALGTLEQRAAGWTAYQELVGTYKLNVKEFLRKLEHNPAACFMLSWLYLTGIATHTDYAASWNYLNRAYELIVMDQPHAISAAKPDLEANASSATKAKTTTATKAAAKTSTAKSQAPKSTSFLESILQGTKQLQKQNDAYLKLLTNFVQSSDDKFNPDADEFVPLDIDPYTEEGFTPNLDEMAAPDAHLATAMRSNDAADQAIYALYQSMKPDLAQSVQDGKSKALDMGKSELTEKIADERSDSHNGDANCENRDSGKDSKHPSSSSSSTHGKVRLSLHRDHKPQADELIPDSNQNSSNSESSLVLVATANELEQTTDSQQAATKEASVASSKKATSKKAAAKQADYTASDMQAAFLSALACQAGLQTLPAQLQLNGLTMERDQVAALNFFKSLTADNKSLDLAALGVDILAQSSESAQGKATKAKSNAKSAKDKSKDKSKDKLSAQNKAVLNLMANPTIVPTAWGYEYLLPQIYALQAGMLLRGFGTGQNQRLALTAIEQCGACMSEAKVPYVMNVVKAINQLWPYLDTPDESFAHYVNRLAHSGDVAARVMFGLSLGYGLLGQAINLKQAQYWLSISEKQGAKAQVINKKFYAAVQQRIKG